MTRLVLFLMTAPGEMFAQGSVEDRELTPQPGGLMDGNRKGLRESFAAAKRQG
jgi:hypothetical protein